MARLHKRHVLHGYSGKVGKHLRLHHKADGMREIRVLEGPPPTHDLAHWERFQDAVAYARKAQHQSEYMKEAEHRHTTPFHVATADFLHPPEILKIGVDDYHGQKGDPIQVHASDDMKVAQVGIIITDEVNHLVEMGMAQRDGEAWIYTATHQAPTHHVRIIVDVGDLPGHLTEGRVEKDV